MNCPPAPVASASLGIMPANIYPHFMDFFYVAQLFWRDDNFPERAESYMRGLFTNSEDPNPYDLTQEEQRRVIHSSVFLAKQIREYPHLVGTMMDWCECFPNPPIPERTT